jgi:hypothetical protein
MAHGHAAACAGAAQPGCVSELGGGEGGCAQPVSTWRQLVVHFSQVPAAAGAFTGSLSAIVLRWWPGLSGGCYSAACDVGYPGEGCISYQIVPLPVEQVPVAAKPHLLPRHCGW